MVGGGVACHSSNSVWRLGQRIHQYRHAKYYDNVQTDVDCMVGWTDGGADTAEAAGDTDESNEANGVSSEPNCIGVAQ